MAKSIYRVLGERVRAERQRAGLTLEKLGERAEISGAFVAHIEAGRKRATLATVAKIAHALGLAATDLLREEVPGRPAGDVAAAREFSRLLRGKSPAQRRAILLMLRAAADLASS